MSGMNIASPKALLTCGAPSPHVLSKKKNHIVSNEYNLSLTFFVYNSPFTAHFWLGLLSIFHRLRNISCLDAKGTSQMFFEGFYSLIWASQIHQYKHRFLAVTVLSSHTPSGCLRRPSRRDVYIPDPGDLYKHPIIGDNYICFQPRETAYKIQTDQWTKQRDP